jgi:hypothetical protein
MPGGRVIIRDDQRGVLGSSDSDRRLTESDASAGQLTGGDHHLTGRATTFDLRRGTRLIEGSAHPPRRGHQTAGPRAGEEISPDHADHGENKDPQKDDQAYPGDCEDKLWQGG